MAWDARKAGQLAAAAVVVVGGVAGAIVLAQPSGDAGPSSQAGTSTQMTASAPAAPRVDLTATRLTMDIAQWVWDESWSAREAQDPARYEASTCGKYVGEEKSLRKIEATDTGDLLAAFEESKKYRPPWSIDDTTLVSAEHVGGNSGWLRTEATVTDNRTIPPTTDRREVDYEMTRNEDGRWKLCPSMTPIG
jgi:hypothetical protein